MRANVGGSLGGRRWRLLALLGGMVATGVGGGILAAAPAGGADAPPTDISVTVYNNDLGLVRDLRRQEVGGGSSEIRFTEVAARIDPTSVHLRSRAGGGALKVLEQNYRFDLATPEAILTRYLDHEIQAVDERGEVSRGVLLSQDATSLVLGGQEPGGGVRILTREGLTRLDFPELPEGLVTKPTLVWQVESPRSGRQELELEYLTSGINWHAEYVAVVAPASDRLVLNAWVSVDNRSGAGYPDARLKLVAGEVHRVQEPLAIMAGARRPSKMAEEDMQAFEEKPFFEYHLYTLGRRTTIQDKEIKQITLFEPAEVRAEKAYKYDGERWGKDVHIVLKVKNKKEEGLGIPLPAGKVRVYQRDVDEALEFVGEDRIEHTPRDEDVDLYLGNAFDISAERAVTDARRISDRVSERTVEIKIRNHKETPVVVTGIEHLYGFWEIIEATHEYRKKDAYTVEFKIPAPQDQEVVARYRVRQVM